jgi:hypothetical protein
MDDDVESRLFLDFADQGEELRHDVALFRRSEPARSVKCDIVEITYSVGLEEFHHRRHFTGPQSGILHGGGVMAMNQQQGLP